MGQYVMAQQKFTTHKIISIGYQYQNQSFAEVGGKLLFLKNDHILYRAGASVLMGANHQKFSVISKLQGDILVNFDENVDISHSIYYLLGADFTTKYFTPKVGLSLFGILDISAGYSLFIDNELVNGRKMKGLNFNIGLNLPISFFEK
jgi:hypothetical protein